MSDVNEWDFTFTWCIEGFFCYDPEKEVDINTPEFTIEAFENSEWRLVFRGFVYQKEEYISCFLHHWDAKIFSVFFKIQVMTGSGETLEARTNEATFECLDEYGLTEFITRRELLEKMKNCRSDVLSVHCSMRRTEDTVTPLAQKGEGWTRILTDRSCFEWRLKFLESSGSVMGRRYFYLGDMLYEMEAETSLEALSMSVRSLWKTSSENVVNVKIILLDAIRNEVFSFEQSQLFKSDNETSNIYLPNTKISEFNKIVKERLNDIVQDGEIILQCEFNLHYVRKTSVLKSQKNVCFNIKNIFNISNDFRNLLSSESHSDVKLKADSKVVKAHRSVLAARSPVFSAMFDNDMLENRTGTVDISDIDEDTLQSFLGFLYTGEMDDLDFDKASKLLLIAEKYQVSSLKEECCHFLILNLCVENVCSVLALADMVTHETVKNSCIKFIAAHVDCVCMFPEWLQMVKENAKLATEVTLYIGRLANQVKLYKK